MLFYPLVSWGYSPGFPGVCPHKTRCLPGSRIVGKPAAWVEKLHCKRLPVGKPCLDLLQHLLRGAERHQSVLHLHAVPAVQCHLWHVPAAVQMYHLISSHCPLGQHLDLVMSAADLLKMMGVPKESGGFRPQVFIRDAFSCSSAGAQEQEIRWVCVLYWGVTCWWFACFWSNETREWHPPPTFTVIPCHFHSHFLSLPFPPRCSLWRSGEPWSAEGQEAQPSSWKTLPLGTAITGMGLPRLRRLRGSLGRRRWERWGEGRSWHSRELGQQAAGGACSLLVFYYSGVFYFLLGTI